MFNECSKSETEELEKITTPVANIVLISQKDLKFYSLYFSLISWTSKIQKESKPLSIYQQWQKFSEAIGFKPQYHKTYECRNAVWGLKYKDHSFVIYLDKRGLQIQMSESVQKDMVYEILNKLHLKLFGTSKPAPNFAEQAVK